MFSTLHAAIATRGLSPKHTQHTQYASEARQIKARDRPSQRHAPETLADDLLHKTRMVQQRTKRRRAKVLINV